MSLARVSLLGQVEKAPETRFTNNQNVPVCNLSLLVPAAPGSKMAQPFSIKVICWRGLASAVAEQVQAGQSVWVEGRLQLNSYQTPEGVTKKSFEIEATQVSVIDGAMIPVIPSATGAPGQAAPQRQPAMASTAAAAPMAPASADLFDSADDIPF
ncbi:MAG: single-stranded DNA-binding protein [Vampirovibrionales bacterium]|nr:single-stranded DNA-binding protein [Vampirovibrionales bacterium]